MAAFARGRRAPQHEAPELGQVPVHVQGSYRQRFRVQTQAPRVIVRRGSLLMHWLFTADDPCSSMFPPVIFIFPILQCLAIHSIYIRSRIDSATCKASPPLKRSQHAQNRNPTQAPPMQTKKVTLTPCMLRARVAASAADLVWQGEAEPRWWEVTWSSRAVSLFQRSVCSGWPAISAVAKTVET